MREASPPQLHQSNHPRKPALMIRRSPTPKRERSGSRSPRPDVRDRRVSYADQEGNPLAKVIPPSTNLTFQDMKAQVPRKEGESRSQWKSRVNLSMLQAKEARK